MGKSPPRPLEPLVVAKVKDAPPPPKLARGRPTDAQLTRGLLDLPLHGCIDVNRENGNIHSRVAALRKQHGITLRVVVRTVRPGWSRVWRVR